MLAADELRTDDVLQAAVPPDQRSVHDIRATGRARCLVRQRLDDANMAERMPFKTCGCGLVHHHVTDNACDVWDHTAGTAVEPGRLYEAHAPCDRQWALRSPRRFTFI